MSTPQRDGGVPAIAAAQAQPGQPELSDRDWSKRKRRPWRRADAFDMNRPSLGGLILRYGLLTLLLLVSVGPFVWQLSTSLKGPLENLYAFPPQLIPDDQSLSAYESVDQLIPIYRYAYHSFLVAAATVISNVVMATIAGYVLGCMKFRGRKLLLVLFFSTLLLPGEVTLTSQFLIVNELGLANTLTGVYIPGAIGAVNVLLMMTACRAIPQDVIDAAIIDGANTVQVIRHVVWPNIRGMASVVGVFAFIGAWDDYLWPLVVLSDNSKYTLTVGMAYLNSSLGGGNLREIAAGTILALIPVIIIFATMQRYFFRGVESGAVKG